MNLYDLHHHKGRHVNWSHIILHSFIRKEQEIEISDVEHEVVAILTPGRSDLAEECFGLGLALGLFEIGKKGM